MPALKNIQIPEDVMVDYEEFVIDQFKRANITIGQGANMLGLTYGEFMLFLGKHNVSWIQATPEEIEESYRNLKQVLKRRKR